MWLGMTYIFENQVLKAVMRLFELPTGKRKNGVKGL